MDFVFEFLKSYGAQLSAVGAAVAFIFGVYKFQAQHKASHFWKEFEAYHKLVKELVKELVEPPSPDGAMYVDRQTAAIYELRFYDRYFPHSIRMLRALREKWVAVPNQYSRLIEELDLTIEHISKKL